MPDETSDVQGAGAQGDDAQSDGVQSDGVQNDGVQGDGVQSDAAGGDDVKSRFRDALARKQGGRASGGTHADAGSKVHEQHGPAASRRTFRRKSGG